MAASKALLQAIAVTAELTGTSMSEPAARVFAEDLARYPEGQVIGALTRCRRELKGRLVIADVLTRLDDGRPGAEEAWAMLPKNEGASVVWTDEMAAAFGIASVLIRDGHLIPARMAFLEAYRSHIQMARDSGLRVRWWPSLGHDPADRKRALLAAQKLNRLTAKHVQDLLPYRDEPSEAVAALLPEMTANIERRSLQEALKEARAKKDGEHKDIAA